MQVPIPATPAVIAVGALWLAIVGLGMTGHWLAGLHLSVLLTVLLVALGCSHRGRIPLRLLLFPVLSWGLVWSLSFVLAERARSAPAEGVPESTILGFHPSFAWIVLGYWLVGVAVTTIGFLRGRDDWLSAERWRELERTLSRLEAGRAERSDGSGL